MKLLFVLMILLLILTNRGIAIRTIVNCTIFILNSWRCLLGCATSTLLRIYTSWCVTVLIPMRRWPKELLLLFTLLLLVLEEVSVIIEVRRGRRRGRRWWLGSCQILHNVIADLLKVNLSRRGRSSLRLRVAVARQRSLCLITWFWVPLHSSFLLNFRRLWGEEVGNGSKLCCRIFWMFIMFTVLHLHS